MQNLKYAEPLCTVVEARCDLRPDEGDYDGGDDAAVVL